MQQRECYTDTHKNNTAVEGTLGAHISCEVNSQQIKKENVLVVKQFQIHNSVSNVSVNMQYVLFTGVTYSV